MRFEDPIKGASNLADSSFDDRVHRFIHSRKIGDPETPSLLNQIGDDFWDFWRADRHVPDINKAISCYYNAIKLTLITKSIHCKARLYFSSLGLALEERSLRLGSFSDLKESYAAHLKAVELTADGHPSKPRYLSNLGGSQVLLFLRLGDISNIDASVSSQRDAVRLTSDDDTSRPKRLSNLGDALELRFYRFGYVPDLEEAITIHQMAVNLVPKGDPRKPKRLFNLGKALASRFKIFKEIPDLEASIGAIREALDQTPSGDRNRSLFLNELGKSLRLKFERRGLTGRTLPDLDAAIAAHREAMELAPAGHEDKPGYIMELGQTLRSRFEYLKDVSDIHASITAIREAVSLTPEGHAEKPVHLLNLGNALELRFEHQREDADIKEAIAAWAAASQSIAGAPHTKLRAARRWCLWNNIKKGRQETSTAGIWLRHSPRSPGRLDGFRNETNAAAAAVRHGEADQALEWLEQGRSVVWGQTLQLRSPLDLLQDRDAILSQRLATLSRALDAMSNSAGTSAETRHTQLRAVALERDEVLSEVRRLDGLEDFLGPKKVSQLLRAASIGPIVVINVHLFGCDALVLSPEAGGVIHIPLELTIERARALADSLDKVQSRRSSVRHTESPDRGFRTVRMGGYEPDQVIRNLLAELWKTVTKPVLDKLAFSARMNDHDDLPRLWWCPTGPLAFLPLHAAGIYDTDEPGNKVSDFVVSSYTPTVSGLLQTTPSNPSNPKILAVATSPDHSPLFNTKQEVKLLRQRAMSNSVEIIVAEDAAGTVTHVLEEMKNCDWIHLACHGIQDLYDPTKSAFILADGDLELTEIIKHSLPHAQFAFLSACQTATGDAQLEGEAVHLAAGMLLAGYRSVIATMWSIQDKDGPFVADAVYAEMLKDGKADHTRAAHALHRAVQDLRHSGAPFLSWMPFIHMGV